MSVYVIRAFVEMRETLATNAAILKRLAEIDKTLVLHDTALGDIYEKLLPLLSPPPDPPESAHRVFIPGYRLFLVTRALRCSNIKLPIRLCRHRSTTTHELL